MSGNIYPDMISVKGHFWTIFPRISSSSEKSFTSSDSEELKTLRHLYDPLLVFSFFPV